MCLCERRWMNVWVYSDMQSLWFQNLCVFTSQCQSGLNVQGMRLHPYRLCECTCDCVWECLCFEWGVADESYIKGQNVTKLCAAVYTVLAGLAPMKNAISEGMCVFSVIRRSVAFTSGLSEFVLIFSNTGYGLWVSEQPTPYMIWDSRTAPPEGWATQHTHPHLHN